MPGVHRVARAAVDCAGLLLQPARPCHLSRDPAPGVTRARWARSPALGDAMPDERVCAAALFDSTSLSWGTCADGR